MKILLISNFEEGVGGISVQVSALRDKLRGEGHTCDILSTKGATAKRIKAVFALLSKGRKYDVFHIHACSDRGFLPAILGINIGRLLKKRIVLTFHGGGAEGFFKRKQGLVKRYLSRTSANIVLSGFIGRVFDQYGIPYTVIPNMLESDDSAFRARTEIKPKFIGIRSFTETYNIKCTLKAFDAVLKKYPDASLTLLGDGPLRTELEQYVSDQHLQNVTFVGQVPNTEIYRYLDDADIMVSSSRFDNMPVSVLEGFKAGLLVISSNVGG
ncbi:MAG: glycosyltransferase family 4 protein, partial [Bacteroidales bacterium]|nr:glycosyltransferase family 4 protein [Bacteroidales bacterium]